MLSLGEPAALAEHFEAVAAGVAAVEERLDAVDEPDVARASLVVLAPRIGRDPPRYPVHVGIVGEETSQAEDLAAAAGELRAAPLEEADAPHRADLARRDPVLRLPVVMVVSFEVAAAELDATLSAGGNHLVGVREPGAARGFSVQMAGTSCLTVSKTTSRLAMTGRTARTISTFSLRSISL